MLWYTQQHLQTFDKELVYGHHVVFILSVENVLSAHGITELLFIQLHYYSLWPHGMQYARPLCPSLSPGVCSNSCPLSQWCYLTISSSATLFSFCLNLSQHQSLFQWVGPSHHVAKVLELQLQYQSFQWIFRVDSFKTEWFDLLAVQGTLRSLLQHHNLKASILWCFSLL